MSAAPWRLGRRCRALFRLARPAHPSPNRPLGRPAVEVLPKPLASVSVNIGGLPATVEYAGAAPGNIPGLFQINARISKDVQRGDQVPVRVKIGTASSQDGVTLAVR